MSYSCGTINWFWVALKSLVTRSVRCTVSIVSSLYPSASSATEVPNRTPCWHWPELFDIAIRQLVSYTTARYYLDSYATITILMNQISFELSNSASNCANCPTKRTTSCLVVATLLILRPIWRHPFRETRCGFLKEELVGWR